METIMAAAVTVILVLALLSYAACWTASEADDRADQQWSELTGWTADPSDVPGRGQRDRDEKEKETDTNERS